MIPRRIAAFGSSSIYGTADTEFGGFVNRLRLWHEAVDARNRVYNLGVWGETVESLIQRVAPEAAVRKPHLIMLYPGFNDIRREGSPHHPNAVSIDKFAELMNRLIHEAQRVAPVLMITGYPFDEGRTTPYGTSNWYYLYHDANRYLKRLRVVSKQRDVHLLDLWERWQTKALAPVLDQDGLHCNALGHQQLFEEVKAFLIEVYGTEKTV